MYQPNQQRNKVIGSYMGLKLSVRSEYSILCDFVRNSFFIEGKSGLKYMYGTTGSLPAGYVESTAYPAAILEALPSKVASNRERIDRMTAEQPTLQEIVARKWGKTEELAALKDECKALQQRIDETLKAAEENSLRHSHSDETEEDVTPANPAGLQRVA